MGKQIKCEKSATAGSAALKRASIGNLVRFAPKLSNTIYREKVSGKSVKNRPELERAIDALGTGDILAGSLKRANDGRVAAEAKGTRFGRKPKLTDHQQSEAVQAPPGRRKLPGDRSWARRSEGWRGSAQRRSRQP